MSECRGPAALTFANAVITMMEEIFNNRLRDPPTIDATPASASGEAQACGVPAAEAPGYSSSSSSSRGRRGSGPLHPRISSSGTAGSSSSSSGNGGGAAPPSTAAVASEAQQQQQQQHVCSPPAQPPQPIDQIIVLMDCTGASALDAARLSWVFKAVASSVNHHYPARCGGVTSLLGLLG